MKYELENAMNRKPLTELDIIDECDKFLDDLSNQKSLNLERLSLALTNLKSSKETVEEINDLIIKIIKRRYTENEVYLLKDTLILELLEHFLDNDELKSLLELEDYSYVSKAFEVANTFSSFFDETYLHFYKDKNKHLCIKLITINLDKRLKELLDKFFTLLAKEPTQVVYGKEKTMRALEMSAVDVIVVCDSVDDVLIDGIEEKAVLYGTKVEIIS